MQDSNGSMATSNSTTRRGLVLVVSGPSGAGKSTICHRLCDRLPAEFSVSVTTRPPRPNEVPDQDYHFVERDEFIRMRDADDLLEWAEVYGHFYGTRLQTVEQALDEGRIIILDIDVNGCKQVCDKLAESLAVFIMLAPDTQKKRLQHRATDSEQSIKERLSMAESEIRLARESGVFDAFVENDVLDESIARIETMVRQQLARGVAAPKR